MFNSIFGTGANQAAQSMFGQQQYSTQQGMAQQQANQYAGGLAQQQAYSNQQQSLYNQMRNKPQYVFHGVEYSSVEAMAEAMFPNDPETRLMFVLKHGGA